MSNYNYNTLCHHGIKGQKCGIRRFQNEDGTLTAEGRKRYGIDEFGKMSKEGKKLYKQDKYEQKIIDTDYNKLYRKASMKSLIKTMPITSAISIGSAITASVLVKKKYGTISKTNASLIIAGAMLTEAALNKIDLKIADKAGNKAIIEKNKIVYKNKHPNEPTPEFYVKNFGVK